jgi:hypothetical protein
MTTLEFKRGFDVILAARSVYVGTRLLQCPHLEIGETIKGRRGEESERRGEERRGRGVGDDHDDLFNICTD